jgi:hypothetical protein
MVIVNSALTIHYLGEFVVIITVLGKEAKVFLSCKNTGNTLSQRE